MKRQLLFLTLMLIPLFALADAVEIDGIYYNLIEKGKVAEVTRGGNYTGSVNIPEKVTYNEVEYDVTTISDNAFYGCSDLTSITIPSSITIIGKEAFYGTYNLKSVTITDLSAWLTISFTDESSNPLHSCGHLFMDGKEITELSIPLKINIIKKYAFNGCSGLSSINITSSVITIENAAFGHCKGLSTISIPNSVTDIGNNAFYGCENLISISLPNNITSISGGLFLGCTKLVTINMPNSVRSIGNSSFAHCSSLTSITIPNSVTSINNEAFSGCSSLTSVTIGEGIKNIQTLAFWGCKELTDVYCYAENVPNTRSDAFQDSYIEYATLHVPAASVNAYKEAEPWKNFKQIVAIEGDTPSTPKCAKPTISYDNFKLTYSCETEGVEYISEIKDTDIKKYYDNSVSLGATYEISVYATKSGYDNSDVATATLVFTNATFTTEGTSSAKSANVNPFLIQANNGIITVEGADDGERINVYTPAGSQEGSAISQNRLATINTHLQPGDIAIIKIGSRSVKVVMK